jgi:hypothetical protein
MIEIFSANCLLCRPITDDIEIGKCEGCKQVVYDVHNMTEDLKLKMRDYDVKAVPSTVIDGNINGSTTSVLSYPRYSHFVVVTPIFQRLH